MNRAQYATWWEANNVAEAHESLNCADPAWKAHQQEPQRLAPVPDTIESD